jgi:hypothetical protein
VALEVTVEPSTGAAGLRAELDSGESSLIGSDTDLVVFSIADEIDRLDDTSRGVEELIREIESDLVAVVEMIKEKVGAHVFIANLSTVDPDAGVFNYHGVEVEPYTLRAHRLNLVVVDVSHSEGTSVIDVDRKIAEVGAENAVVAPSRFNEVGCGVIAGEVPRSWADVSPSGTRARASLCRSARTSAPSPSTSSRFCGAPPGLRCFRGRSRSA